MKTAKAAPSLPKTPAPKTKPKPMPAPEKKSTMYAAKKGKAKAC